MIIRCFLCHGVIGLGAGVRYVKGWCRNCGMEYDFEILDDGIISPACLVIEWIDELQHYKEREKDKGSKLSKIRITKSREKDKG